MDCRHFINHHFANKLLHILVIPGPTRNLHHRSTTLEKEIAGQARNDEPVDKPGNVKPQSVKVMQVFFK